MARLLVPWHVEKTKIEGRATSVQLPMSAHRLEWLSWCWRSIWTPLTSVVQCGQNARDPSNRWLRIENSQAAKSFDWLSHAIPVFQCRLKKLRGFVRKESMIANRIAQAILGPVACLSSHCWGHALAFCLRL